MKFIILFFTCIINVFCFLEFFGIFFDRRQFFQKTRLLTIPVMIAGAFVIFLFNLIGNIFVNFISTLLVCYGAVAVVYKIRFRTSIFYTVIMMVFISCIEMSVNGVLCLEKNWLAKSSVSNNASYEFLTPISVLVYAIIAYIPILIARHCFKKEKIRMSNGIFGLYVTIPFLNVIMLLVIPIIISSVFSNSYVQQIYVFYSLATFLCTFILFYTFQKHMQETQKNNDLMKEKYASKHDMELLEISSKALKERLSVVEEAMENERILRHDRRHFENTIYALLQQNDPASIEKAKVLLEEKINVEPKRLRKWCENETINATFEYYISLAEKLYIPVETSINIPKEIRVDSLQLSIALGNLIENAIHENEKLRIDQRNIKIKTISKKQLLIQIENACTENAALNEEGLPFSTESGHGTGTRSVMAFASHTGSAVIYQIKGNVFTVRMII